MPNVYVVNKSNHDFSEAKKVGQLIFLSEGRMSRYAPNSMVREFEEKMKGSTKEDFILLSGLSMMNSIACSLFVHKHRCLNLLLFKNGRYLERNLKFNGDE